MRTAALVLMAMAGLAACGDDARSPAPARAPDAAIVASLPDPFEPGARQPPGTYVGKVGRAGWTYVGVVVRGERALVYLCDGRASEWLGARVRDDRLLVRSPGGTVVDARVGDGVVRGTVQPAGQRAGAFSARAPGAGAGVFSGPDPAVAGRVRRWIVLEDGIRGVSESAPPAGDAGAGSGTATRAPTRTPAPTSTATPITITPTPTPTPTPRPTTSITDGSSNTIQIGEGTPTPAATAPRAPTTTITDGSSNTIQIGEGTPTPAATAPRAPTTTITDGSSNTIQIGESTATPAPTAPRAPTTTITDGSSNTIQIGESTATPAPSASRAPTTTITDGSSRTIQPGESTPAPTSTFQDGASNTIQIGESTATPAPTTTITDGSSNTIQVGETPVNGVAVGAGAPPTAPAPAVTTCPKDTKCPPPAPPPNETASGSVSGGKLLPCAVLLTMIKTLVGPAKTDPVARKQLAALTAQAKANGC